MTKELNKEQLNKVTGGEGETGKWYFCWYNTDTNEYFGEWCGPYDSEDDDRLFANEHPLTVDGTYKIEKKFMPINNTGRTINSYL